MINNMKPTASILLPLLSAVFAAAAAPAQTTPSKPATHTVTTSVAAPRPASRAATTSTVKLPPGIPPVRGPVHVAYTLRYQDIKIGTGAVATPRKLYKVHYTGWLAADGRKFDSSYDHPGQPIIDKDGKMERDADGKVKIGDPQPISFPQGMGRVIPGFDTGFIGMRIGGKRRIFIPWQLAYGEAGRPGPDPAHPGIPPQADLIFDVELVDVLDMPTMPNHPSMGGMHTMPPGGAPRPQPTQTQPATPQAAPSAQPQSAQPQPAQQQPK